MVGVVGSSPIAPTSSLKQLRRSNYLRWSSGYRFGYPLQLFYRRDGVRRRQMAVSLGHSQGAVTQHLRDMALRHARLRQPGPAPLDDFSASFARSLQELMVCTIAMRRLRRPTLRLTCGPSALREDRRVQPRVGPSIHMNLRFLKSLTSSPDSANHSLFVHFA